jgi:hypothetical protein
MIRSVISASVSAKELWHRADHVVELSQHLIGIVELAIAHDVALDTREEPEAVEALV